MPDLSLPHGRVRVYDADVSRKSSVIVEVDGQPVCELAVSQVTRTLSAVMAHSTTSLVFEGGTFNVIWDVGSSGASATTEGDS